MIMIAMASVAFKRAAGESGDSDGDREGERERERERKRYLFCSRLVG